MPQKSKSLFFIPSLLLFFLAFLSHAEVVDKILVIVNDEIITRGDVDRILVPVYMQYKELYGSRELEKKISEVEADILERLVEDKLLLAEARRRGISVTEKELDRKAEETRSGLKQGLKERMMIEKFVVSELQSKVSVSPNELLAYYRAHPSEFREPRRVKLREILIKIKEKRPEDEAVKKSEEILYRLKEGADFASLAREYSEGPYADSGGDMGWINEGQLMDRINGLIFQMQKGEISGILKTKLGFHIFKVEDKSETRDKHFDEEKERIEQLLYNEKRKTALRELIEKLRENAYIEFR